MSSFLALMIGIWAIGADVGWQSADNGESKNINLIKPELLSTLDAGDEIDVGVRPDLHNVQRYRIVVRNDPLSRVAPAPQLTVQLPTPAPAEIQTRKPPGTATKLGQWVPRLMIADQPPIEFKVQSHPAETRRNELEAIELNPPLLSNQDPIEKPPNGYSQRSPSFEAPPPSQAAPLDESKPTSEAKVWQLPRQEKDLAGVPAYEWPTIVPTSEPTLISTPQNIRATDDQPESSLAIDQVNTENATVRMQPAVNPGDKSAGVVTQSHRDTGQRQAPDRDRHVKALARNSTAETVDSAIHPVSGESPYVVPPARNTGNAAPLGDADRNVVARDTPSEATQKISDERTNEPSVVASNYGNRPWFPFTLALFALFASLGGNIYQGWITWDLRRKCRQFLNRLCEHE